MSSPPKELLGSSKKKRWVKEVVAILPYREKLILLQLRDKKKSIVFPGHWGFFSGTIRKKESARCAALRELKEELNYIPPKLLQLKTEYLPEVGHLLSYTFACPLKLALEKLTLQEGEDWGLFSLKEIESGMLYSQKLNRYLPLVPTSYIARSVRRLKKVLNGMKA